MIFFKLKYDIIINIIDRFLNLHYIIKLDNKNKILYYNFLLKFIYIYINFNMILIKNLKFEKKYIKSIYSNIINKKNIPINLKLEGLEYKIINKNNYILFYLGYSNLILIKINKYYLLKNNKLLILHDEDLSYNYLKNIKFQLFKLKVLNKYKQKGFLYE